MTIVFKSEEDAKKVAAFRRAKPSFYDSSIKNNREISNDMEAVLILISNEVKQKVKQQIDAQNESTDRIKKRDALLSQALEIEKSNAERQIKELNRKVTTSNFQDAFHDYGSVSEVGELLNSVQLGTEETLVALERAEHRQACAYVLADRTFKNGISEDADRERKSWGDVVSAYSGTPSAVPNS